jgi:hypothetical protein
MKKLLLILFCLPLLYSCNSNNNLDKALIKTVEEINKSCPLFVDEQTRLDYSEIDENGFLHYIYTFPLVSKSDIDVKSFYVKQSDLLNHNYYSNKDLIFLKENDVFLKYTYLDMFNNQIISIVIPNNQNMIGSNGKKLELSVISYPSPLSAGDWPESGFKKTNKELKSEYKIGDKIRIEYSINDKGDSFIPPDVSDFNLLGKPEPSTLSRYESKDGEMINTKTTTYSFNIEAKTVGLYTINSASIIVNGKRISSEEIQLNIISSYLK